VACNERRIVSGERRLVGVVGRFDPGSGDEAAEGFFAARPALGCGNVAVAVDYHIDWIDVGLIHGGEIGLFHHDDFAVAGMLLEVFFDGLLGFADIDGEKDQTLVGKLVADLVDEGGFVGAEAAPGGPELEENDFAFDVFVVEFFASGRGGVETGRGLFVLGAGERADGGEDQYAGNRYTEEAGARGHGENVRKLRAHVNCFVGTFEAGSGPDERT